MFNPKLYYERGGAEMKTALVPIFDTVKMTLTISTRSGDSVLNKGDGTSLTSISNQKLRDYTDGASITNFSYNYANPFTGNVSVKFLRGLKDVYSIDLTEFQQDTTTAKFNITDIEAFFAQFPNLYSLRFDEYAYQTSARMSIIKGDFAKLPNSVERVLIENIEVIPALNANQQLLVNFSSYDAASKLKYFRYTGGINWIGVSLKIIGDLSKLPTSCNHLYLVKASSGSAITYTAGKVWASAFDTLYLPIPLTATENDNLFIDFDNSVTTAVGSKMLSLPGFRSYLSDGPKASIVSKGFSVAPMNQIRSYATLGTTETTPNFYAYIPNTTSLDFGTGSLTFGCTVKFNAITGTKGIIGKSVAAANNLGRYAIYISGGNIIVLSETILGSPTTNTITATSYNDGNFHTIEVTCNRTTGKQTLKIDGVLINTSSFTPSSNNITRNARFMIGAYGNATGDGLLANSVLDGIVKNVYVTKF